MRPRSRHRGKGSAPDAFGIVPVETERAPGYSFPSPRLCSMAGQLFLIPHPCSIHQPTFCTSTSNRCRFPQPTYASTQRHDDTDSAATKVMLPEAENHLRTVVTFDDDSWHPYTTVHTAWTIARWWSRQADEWLHDSLLLAGLVHRWICQCYYDFSR